jgi:pyruvate kinase
MVARGDLALEMSLPEVPIAQKKIINACRTTATPVITATQMLESMTHNHKPTRAEVTDVANAILDGTDAIMLSGESAIGKYPVDAVATMAAIARRTEDALDRGELGRLTEPQQIDSLRSSVGQANRDISRRMKCAAMVVYTLSGATARWVLSHRPETPVLALCPTNAIRRRLTLSWGARSRLVPAVETLREMRRAALEAVVAEGLAKSGDLVTISAGQPFGEPDNTNLLMIERVP